MFWILLSQVTAAPYRTQENDCIREKRRIYKNSDKNVSFWSQIKKSKGNRIFCILNKLNPNIEVDFKNRLLNSHASGMAVVRSYGFEIDFVGYPISGQNSG